MERVKPEIQEAVNNNLKILIREKAGNVTAFAKSIGTSRDSVNNWLQGKSDIRLNDLVAISEKYGWSVDYLLGLADSPTRSGNKQAAEEYTGLSPEAIDNIRNLPDRFVGELLAMGVAPDSALFQSGAMFNAFVRFLSSSLLSAFLASLVKVSQARDAVKVAIDLGITGEQAGEILEKQRFSLFRLGTQAQKIAREIYGVDRYEEQLSEKVSKSEKCNIERRRSSGRRKEETQKG